ncbi:MAG: CopG family antitoxin [Patescibacteria group bacterium]
MDTRMRTKENKIKIKKVKKGTIAPIPPFRTLGEEADFWDTHSMVDKIDDRTLVGFHSARKSRTLTIRFSEKSLEVLRRHALNMGVGPTTLARMWLLERLRSVK